jgi:hypothetical protein
MRGRFIDREMDVLTMALKNPEQRGRYRGYGVVPWKYAFKGNLDNHKVAKEEESVKRSIGVK